jgi:hypothetical protein
MFRRTVLCALIATALALPAAAAASTLYTAKSVCGTSCGTWQSSKGSGFARVWASGTGYGDVGSGSIWFKDRLANGKIDYSVSGWNKRIYRGDGWYEFRGTNMSFLATNKWVMKINASGVYARVVADGTVTLRGSNGTFAMNGGSWRHWPSVKRSYNL